ncbi:helix-turn-helix transcriptional regulator [Microbacterium sp. NPDC056234]|uniref:helix-turn-helix transcriptional regulator n=1 Tax=Microbacterium sp. NPDC056234 TaxID=3345757 RepID=UPI0035E07333
MSTDEFKGATDKAIGARLRQELNLAGMTQAELVRGLQAAGASWHPKTIREIIAGRRTLTFAEAMEIADVLSIDVQQLYRGPLDPELQGIIGHVRDGIRLRQRILDAVSEMEALRLKVAADLDALSPDHRASETASRARRSFIENNSLNDAVFAFGLALGGKDTETSGAGGMNVRRVKADRSAFRGIDPLEWREDAPPATYRLRDGLTITSDGVDAAPNQAVQGAASTGERD